MSLKQKTISGMMWSFIDNMASQGSNFIIGIVLARLLVPRDFGLIGMITIFIAVSQSFIDSGFSQALIRKKNCSQADYSTVFYFNLIVGIFFYLLMFFTAGSISAFFKEPQLKLIVQVLGINLIINALTIIQLTQLTRRIDFKLQTRISILASIGSGAISIVMALKGFGVWSLVAKSIGQYALKSFFLWFWNGWKPSWLFDKKSFKEMFAFGSKLLVSGLIDTTFKNIYYLVIGKYFSAVELGYYTRADQFQGLPSQNLTGVIQRVSYPVLASIRDEGDKLKSAYRKLIKSSMLISFVLMLGLAATARPLVLTLIGKKWLPCVIYLQLLCFVGMLYPLHALNLNMLTVQGRSDLFLRLEIIKKMIFIPMIVVGVIWGIKMMILGMLLSSIFAYFLNSYWSGKMIGYSSVKQLQDIMPSFLLAATMGAAVYAAGAILKTKPWLTLLIQAAVGGIIVFGAGEIFGMGDYQYIKGVAGEYLFSGKNRMEANERQ
jgi:O-antigen/teichoic acid export membrane protein